MIWPIASIFALMLIAGVASVLIFRPKQGYSSLKAEKKIDGEIERIGQFSTGSRRQNSFVLHLKGYDTPFYAHPNFGKDVYSPAAFTSMSETLSLTKTGDRVEIEIATLNKPDGSSEQLILKFTNLELAKN